MASLIACLIWPAEHRANQEHALLDAARELLLVGGRAAVTPAAHTRPDHAPTDGNRLTTHDVHTDMAAN